jgi:hypothetical protein
MTMMLMSHSYQFTSVDVNGSVLLSFESCTRTEEGV